MNPNDLIVSVYKTNITKKDLILLKPILDNFNKIIKWNIDLEDCDKILRIESKFNINKEIINKLESKKLKCVELK